MPTHLVPATDGVQVAVHDFGGRGPALVMAHAAGFHGQVFAPLAAALTGRFRCVAPDLRGHGDTRLPPEQALDWFGLAADVLAAVDGLGLDRPYAFGHSSGGAAVLLAEQARPGTFQAIYCFEPIVIPPDSTGANDRGARLATHARRRRDTFQDRDEALAHYSSKPPLDALAPAALRAYVDHGFDDDGAGGARLKCRPEDEAAVYDSATAHDAYARLGEVGCPVTVACGGATSGCTGDRPFASEDRLPQGRSEVVPGVGHFGPLERPDVVAGFVGRALLSG